MKWLFKKPIAHRGLHDIDACENSLSAFAKAVEGNYGIELDIQLTKDKQVIVFHDDNTKRMTSKSMNINQSSYDSLKTLKLLNTEDEIPLFRDVLKEIKGQVPLLIEIKNEKTDEEFEYIIANILDGYEGLFAIQSFNAKSMAWFKNNRPHFVRGLIFGDEKSSSVKIIFKFLMAYLTCKPHFVALDYLLLKTDIVKICHFMRIPLLCWTINSKAKAKKALALVDNIIFEEI
ncbi:MAG: glycerophosphodiester phosphodiesterase family protein [Candidatus Marinarcus sp.]|uniref:glycerophosphodiester phosphodiesterase family protein n=1 Tax=Candidatus Marinarcus sp. TaxID=3100987 RepID=UPI003B00D88A